MIQDVFIIGAPGRVGKILVEQIIKKEDTDPVRHPNPTRIVGLAVTPKLVDSPKMFIYSHRGISDEQAYRFASRDYSASKSYSALDELVEAADIRTRKNLSSLVFVDVTPLNEEMVDLHKKIIQETPYGIVTANKNPIALSDYPTFQLLTANPKRYGYRCSVMAGADSVPFLQDVPDLNDPLYKIEGCFSGTLGYITSNLEKGRKFSEILREAHREGYTETDPRDDLSGLDVARKIIVIARSAGYEVGIGDINLSPFIPSEYFNGESIEDFLRNAEKLDKYFAALVESAKRKDNTIRYVATMDARGDRPQIDVSLREVVLNSSLGRLQGPKNKILITTEAYPDQDNCYEIGAPGAGLVVTARNVRRDLMHLLPERTPIQGHWNSHHM